MTSTFTKADAIDSLVAAANLPRALAGAAVDNLLDDIAAALARGEPVKFAGFGSLVRKTTKGGAGRNPRTGEPITIPPGHKVKFTPAAALKDRLAAAA